MPAEAASDAELWTQLLADPNRGMAVVYDLYASTVYGLARRILSHKQEAEDLTHEVFVSLLVKGSYDPARGSLVGFLCTVTRSRAIDRIRGRNRARIAMAEFALDKAEETTPAASDELALAQSSAHVRAALAELPSTQRQAIELAYFQGLSQTEIAAQLAAPLGTVKFWVRGGLLALRAKLSRSGGT